MYHLRCAWCGRIIPGREGTHHRNNLHEECRSQWFYAKALRRARRLTDRQLLVDASRSDDAPSTEWRGYMVRACRRVLLERRLYLKTAEAKT